MCERARDLECKQCRMCPKLRTEEHVCLSALLKLEAQDLCGNWDSIHCADPHDPCQSNQVSELTPKCYIPLVRSTGRDSYRFGLPFEPESLKIKGNKSPCFREQLPDIVFR